MNTWIKRWCMEQERRRLPRKGLRTIVKITISEQRVLEANAVDISLQGMCLIVPEQLVLGQVYILSFGLTISGAIEHMNLSARVVYNAACGIDGFRIGCQLFDLDLPASQIIKTFLEY